MSAQNIKVSVGLPVYNGENFVADAIDSILQQSFRDFELIISDNASNDATEEICRDLARRDSRIRYHRNPTNLGASCNYTKVFQLARGKYFKWAAHDDVCHQDFLQKAVDVLDRDATVVICHALTQTIDEQGRLGLRFAPTPELMSAGPYQRFCTVLPSAHLWIWGLTRRSVLAKTRLLGPYPEHDRPFLSEVTLHGKIFEIPEFLFYHREHSQRSVHTHDFHRPHQAWVWYDPNNSGKLMFPAWRLLSEHCSGIRRAPIAWYDKARCYGEMVRWVGREKFALTRDLVFASTRLPFGAQLFMKGWNRHIQANWTKRTKRVAETIGRAVPVEQRVILVDNCSLDRHIFDRWQILTYPEKDGEYMGPPKDDDEAIGGIVALRKSGVAFIVLAWPAFWWLDHYRGLRAHLEEKYLAISKTSDAIVFKWKNES